MPWLFTGALVRLWCPCLLPQGVFPTPEYSVSEEARTPNVHSRQGEGAR